jgi:hypothetical protein
VPGFIGLIFNIVYRKNRITFHTEFDCVFRITYGELYMNADYRYLLRELMGRAAALHALWWLLSSPSSLAAALPWRH